MPILPPRNLPLSPDGNKSKKEGSSVAKGSPSNKKAGSSTPVKNRAYSDQSQSPSNAKAKPSIAAQVERQDETTFHRRLRSLLYDHRTARETWDDLVSIEGAKAIAAICQLSTQLEESLVKSRASMPHAYADLPSMLRMSKADYEAVRLDKVASLAQALRSEQEKLSAIFIRLEKAASKLEALSDVAYILLVDCTRSKGDQFAFETEAWTTWSIARFIDTIRQLSGRYAVQTAHLIMLGDTMLRTWCKSDANPTTNTSKEGLDEEDSQDEDDVEDDKTDSDTKASRKGRALLRQRILEEWQTLSYLRDDVRGRDGDWFEDICEVEVGRWDE